MAVLIPCRNEESTVELLIADANRYLPDAVVYVYDNCSTDRTAEVAERAGALVRREGRRGKGNVVRRMLADVEADVYVLVDGDSTYDLAHAPALVSALVCESADMIVGARNAEPGAYAPGHRFGNKFFSLLLGLAGAETHDPLSGLRVLSRRLAKTFPAHSNGFQIEAELTLFAAEHRLGTVDIQVPYRARPHGSTSKLHPVRDGCGILSMILTTLARRFVSALVAGLAAALAVAAVMGEEPLGLWLAAGTGIISVGLAKQSRARSEAFRTAYLGMPGPDRRTIGDVGLRALPAERRAS